MAAASRTLPAPSRRTFLTGAGALVIGVALPVKALAQSGAAKALAGEGPAAVFAPNAFIRIAADDTVTVLIKHIEFGQGPFTGLATLVAEELDADWSQIRAEHAPADVKLYANAAFGVQGTGGSTAMAVSFDLMRKAGAAARAMLVAAAAKSWGVPAGEITIAKGVISHAGSGKTGRFGAFAEAAAAEAAPAEPVLKTPDTFVFIGKETPKLDTKAKSDGSATFTLDVYREGMLTAVVAHAPKFGGKVASADDGAARAVKGVVDVKATPFGVAVLAENSYAALKGRDALKVTWDESEAETRSSEQMVKEQLAMCAKRGATAGARGSTEEALKAEGVRVFEADYVFPYLAHAPMEPLDAVIERTGEGVTAWMGSQLQTVDQGAIAQVCGVPPEKVAINTMLAGGSFGRRAQPSSQFAAEAAAVFMAAGGTRPVKLMWTREDDIRGGFYRPLTVHRLRAAVDAAGAIKAWEQIVAGQSFLAGSPFAFMLKDGLDPLMVEGAGDLPYAIPNLHVSAHIAPSKVPTLWWRSVGHTHTGYAVETFIDELLEAAGKDAIAGRLALMAEAPRMAGVLSRAAEMADWGRMPAAGRALGAAVVHSFNSYVAQIAEVSMEGPTPRVHKVWCAVDCGIAVNPNIIAAQMEGGIGYGLGAMLFDEITLDEGGSVRQSNFHDYRSLRMGEMPEVEVAIIASSAPPTGVGEPGVPPIAPAVGNALRKLTGKTPRRLPVVTAAV